MLAAPLGALEEHLGFVGDRIVRAIGLTWSIACVLVVPVIVRDNAERNPMAYLKCSAGVIRQTWGEALVGFIGLRGVPILFFAGFGMLWIVSLIVAFFTMVDRPMLALAIGGEFFIGLPSGTVLSYLCGMIQKIYIGAL